jgi:hypothetical protein
MDAATSLATASSGRTSTRPPQPYPCVWAASSLWPMVRSTTLQLLAVSVAASVDQMLNGAFANLKMRFIQPFCRTERIGFSLLRCLPRHDERARCASLLTGFARCFTG